MHYRRTLLPLIIFCLVFVFPARSQDIIPAHPTHFFYTPAPNINPPYSLVLSLHEISYALPYNLQVQASLLDNIGRLNLAARYAFSDNFSIAGGLASSLVHVGDGTHGVPEYADPRFGLFLCYGPVMNESMEISLTPHTQIGDRVSLGFDFGMYARPNPVWGLIWEVGSSLDFKDVVLYLNTDGGLRITPPSLPYLHFDVGIDFEEAPVVDIDDGDVLNDFGSIAVYFDVIFGAVVK